MRPSVRFYPDGAALAGAAKTNPAIRRRLAPIAKTFNKLLIRLVYISV
jgi:hypothetical protein